MGRLCASVRASDATLKVCQTTKPCQDGHFLQRSQSHQSQRGAAVQQDSSLPARAAQRRPDLTTHHTPACGETALLSPCHPKPVGCVDTFLTVSYCERAYPRSERGRASKGRAEGVGGLFAVLKHRKKTANSHAAH